VRREVLELKENGGGGWQWGKQWRVAVPVMADGWVDGDP